MNATGASGPRHARRLPRRLLRGLALALLGGATLVGLGALGLWAASFLVPFPEALQRSEPESVRVLDRGGHLLGQVRRDGEWVQRVSVAELSPHVVPALLAAEDRRFFSHPGIDAFAIARAAAQRLRHGRIVSGASTITQQLARTTFERPRNLGGKLHEMAIALRLERQLDKQQILDAYLNRVAFGPRVVGIEAAALAYFGKSARHSSLSEAATLVAIPRGPVLYDPTRSGTPIQLRRDRVLERMRRAGFEREEVIDRALSLPVQLHPTPVVPGAHHWVRRAAASVTGGELRTTLDSALQQRIEQLVRDHAVEMANFGASSAAVIVIDNPSREVLAYVGSPDYFAEPGLGQNDGVVALRQPGSTLKPFVYAAAMERLGYTAATLLPDVERDYGEPGAPFIPRNYDAQHRGPVRLREALASSLNIPAVDTAARVGPARVLELLHRFGFSSLRERPEHYGAALALGDGEVTLEELGAAYAALADAGRYAPLVFRRDERLEQAGEERRQVIAPEIAAILWDVLSDPVARATGFGRHGPLEFPFEVAVKTGTSKGARDNWTVGGTRALTVAVWVGNFDGTPMRGASGVSGAAPLFRLVLNEASRGEGAPRSRAHLPPAIHEIEVCALSGALPTPLCPQRLRELFIRGTEPKEPDRMHAEVFVEQGKLARPGCAGATPLRVERYPTAFVDWAKRAGRPLAPELRSARCPPEPG